MAATTVGLVYSAATGRLRWWIAPDSDAELATFRVANAGETMAVVSRAQYLDGGGVSGLQALVNTISGKTPENDRYADFDAGGNVVAATFACPLCGDGPAVNLTRVQHQTAGVGGFFLGSLYFQPSVKRRRSFRRRSGYRMRLR